MAILAVDEVMLREPRLLVQNMAPLGRVTINEQHPAAQYLSFLYIPSQGFFDLCTGKAIPPTAGVINSNGTANGLAHKGQEACQLRTGITTFAGYDNVNSTMLVAGVCDSIGAFMNPLTLSNSATVYTSRWINISDAGAVIINYGDGGGVNPADRRSLATANGAITAGVPFCFCCHFLSATTGLIAINGNSKSLTASGTGVAMSTSDVEILLHNSLIFPRTSFVSILAVAVFRTTLPTSVAVDLSRDPFQIFAAA